MNNEYQPRSFWNERFGKYGHTGEVDGMLYAYDQPQRIRAIGKTLVQAGVTIHDQTKILDFGCGTGDLIESFLKHGQPEITAIDISDETIRHVRQRFAVYPNVAATTAAVQDIGFLPASFDLSIGINVLQHIIDEQTFACAIEAILRVTKTGGHIMTMDFAPFCVQDRLPASYVIVRSRQEYVEAFESRGCQLVYEFGLPRIGVRLYRTIYQTVARLARRQGRSKMAPSSTALLPGSPSRLKSRLNMMIKTIVLTMALPFDYLLAPFPARHTDMRILLFEKKVSV